MKDIISRRRKELGLTQQELAEQLFVSDKVISKWETGKSVPDTSILVELSNVLEISLDELLNFGKKVETKNLKLAVADNVKMKYHNAMIMTIALAIVASILFLVARMIDYNDYHREYGIFALILYILSSILLIGSIGVFVIARNKIIIDFPKFKDIDKSKVRTIIIFYWIIIFVATFVIVCTHRLEALEALIALSIAGTIESLVCILIYYFYNKYYR